MLGITPFGWLHTIISLVAVFAGIISFFSNFTKQLTGFYLLALVYIYS